MFWWTSLKFGEFKSAFAALFLVVWVATICVLVTVHLGYPWLVSKKMVGLIFVGAAAAIPVGILMSGILVTIVGTTVGQTTGTAAAYILKIALAATAIITVMAAMGFLALSGIGAPPIY